MGGGRKRQSPQPPPGSGEWRVAAGERLTITRYGTPVAELGPVPGWRRRFVSRAALAADAAKAPRIDAQRFRDDLDAVVDPDITVS